MDLISIYDDMRSKLQEARFETPDMDARLIVENCTGFRWIDLIANPEAALSGMQIAACEEALAKRLAHMPVSRIFGEREFWGLSFQLSSDTLDPRPDTETLVSASLSLFGDHPPSAILDLGTGTGCILLALLSEFRAAQGVGVDRSFGAVQTARENARRLDLDSRAAFLCGNWADSLEARFDLIVANPPYIATQTVQNLSEDVRNYDPILALDGGEDGLQAYKEIFSGLKSLLKKGGKALFEIGFDQEKTMVRLARKAGFCFGGVHRDLSGRARVVEISCGDK